MKYPRVPVIVRRPHRPEWGKYCCIYLIHYLNGFLYAGRFTETKNRRLGYPYVGSGFVQESLGLKLQKTCTFNDLSFHASKIAIIEQWYCDPRFHSKLESWFIRRCAAHYGISPRVLDFFEPNLFTESFVRPDGLLLNCHDNGLQQGKTVSTIESHCAGSLKAVQVRKSSNRYFSKSGLDSLSQKISKQRVDGKISPVSLLFYFQGLLYVVSTGVHSCARKATEITGIYVAASSLSKSLKRNHGDTWYKGIHFKYTSLLTEDELKNAVTL